MTTREARGVDAVLRGLRSVLVPTDEVRARIWAQLCAQLSQPPFASPAQQTQRVSRTLSRPKSWTWDRVLRASGPSALTGLPWAASPPQEFSLRSATIVARLLEGAGPLGEDAVALSRCLSGSGPYWPASYSKDLLLLRCWPSRRARLGHALQLFASFAPSTEALLLAAGLWLRKRFDDALAMTRSELSRAMTKLGGPAGPAGALAGDLALFIGRSLEHDRGALAPVVKLAPGFLRAFEGRLADPVLETASSAQVGAFCRAIARSSRPALARAWRQGLALQLEGLGARAGARTEAAWDSFALVESQSYARHTTRTALAFRSPLRAASLATDVRVELMSAACRAALRTGRQDLNQCLERYTGKQALWPALARLSADRATQSDRELLRGAAETANTENASELLRWGLKYYVRGDVLTESGPLSLDELCDELKVPRLPLLEDASDADAKCQPPRKNDNHRGRCRTDSWGDRD